MHKILYRPFIYNMFQDRLIAKKLDWQIVPAQINQKNLCECLDPCLVHQLLEFALRLNYIKNSTTCPTSTQGIQSSQPSDKVYCPTRIPWKTRYECKTGKKLVLGQREMKLLYDYMTTKNSIFGPILKEVLVQQQDKKFARNHVYPPSSTQGLTISQQGDWKFCTKVKRPSTRHVYTTKQRAYNCCHAAKKHCSCPKGSKCFVTNCY